MSNTDGVHTEVKVMPKKPAKTKDPKPTTTSASIVAHFVFERETKGAVRYMQVKQKGDVVAWMSDENGGPTVGTLYIRKMAFAEGTFPKAITITITQ